MVTAEADIQTSHAASYLERICGHLGKMSAAGHRLVPRPGAHGRGRGPPEVRGVEHSTTQGSVMLDWGRWTMRATPRALAIRAEAADEDSLQRIQDLLTARLLKFGRREHLAIQWRRPGTPPEAGREAS